MNTNLDFKLLALGIFSGILLACNDAGNSPVENAASTRFRLSDLSISIQTFSGVYDSFPTVPPIPKYASVSATLTIRNNARSTILDTLFLKEGTLYRSNTHQVLPTFTFDFVCKANGAEWAGRLLPGQEDTIWCSYRFEPSLAPCGDSVYIKMKFANPYGDSLIVTTPTILFECSS